MTEGSYDVFLCYNSRDKAAVDSFARRLKDAGFRVFFDDWEMIPGGPFLEQPETALKESRT